MVDRHPARPSRLRVLSLLVLALPLPACIEERLAVEIAIQVHADGSCTRRTEYVLERVDRDKDTRVAIEDSEDTLRLHHRFPSGEGWQRTAERRGQQRVVVVEGQFPSPNAIDWDYWRQRSPRAPAARNFVSFAVDEEDETTVYDYAETFLDPASPLTASRVLAQLLLKADSRFAELLAKEVADAPLARRDVQRLFREHLGEPFAREVGRLTQRPVHGPRERKDIERLLEGLDKRQAETVEALTARFPAVDAETMTKAVDRTMDALAEQLEKDMIAQGMELALVAPDDASRLRFRVTLTLPGPIVRANTCVQGDTAVWEFTGDDLYGRGFEMWARAAVPR